MTKDFQIQEASQFAYITFKRLMYYTCDKPEKFLPEVTEALTAFENQSIARTGAVERQASTLFAAGEAGLARDGSDELQQSARDGCVASWGGAAGEHRSAASIAVRLPGAKRGTDEPVGG